MITAKRIVNELNRKGLNAKYQAVTKNGVQLQAVTIKEEGINIAPCIYLDEVVEDANRTSKSLDDVVNYVMAVYEAHRQADIDTKGLLSRDYIMEHVNVALQRAGNDEIIKRTTALEGIEEYLYITVDMNGTGGTIKLKPEHLAYSNIEESELWTAAYNNLHDSVVIQKFSDMMPFLGEAGAHMFVLTNNHSNMGASAALDRQTIETLAEMEDFTDYVLIPSSRHEVIIIPDNGMMDIDIEEMTNIVLAVNSEVVNPLDQLSDRAYKLTV